VIQNKASKTDDLTVVKANFVCKIQLCIPSGYGLRRGYSFSNMQFTLETL